MSSPAPLQIEGLAVTYADGSHALRGVDLEVGPGRCVALVGESGSGKSTLIAAALGLLPRGAAWSGAVRVAGHDVLSLPERERRRWRGRVVGYVPQDPFTALDPLRSVAHHVRAAARAHGLRLGTAEVAHRLEGPGHPCGSGEATIVATPMEWRDAATGLPGRRHCVPPAARAGRRADQRA